VLVAPAGAAEVAAGAVSPPILNFVQTLAPVLAPVMEEKAAVKVRIVFCATYVFVCCGLSGLWVSLESVPEVSKHAGAFFK
jgi:hypothetical protein